MSRDAERMERLRQELTSRRWDAVVATLPDNVLLLSGYWPVIGDSLAIVTRDGHVAVLAPEDEQDLVGRGWADKKWSFEAASLGSIHRIPDAVRVPLAGIAADLGLGRGSTIGYEDEARLSPCPYAAMFHYGAELPRLLADAIPHARLAPAGDLFARARAVLTAREVEHVRAACRVAEHAYRQGLRGLRAGLRAGLTERAAAALFREGLMVPGVGTGEHVRADGLAFCMSGKNAARAAAAYQRSRGRVLSPGDLALIHCNSYVDGFFTDVTRTFCLGQPDDRQRQIYQAVLAARQAAIEAVCPGAAAADVDRAARDVLRRHGFDREFPHATGHGVGFAAIDHHARPRIHPASDEVLETGMTFNIEPAVYIEGYGGVRHCDMVTVTRHGAEVLTPSLATLDSLVVA